MKKIKVTFETLTPLWTGDAWQENNEIRPSSIMGSLRFWFEVICYFSKITSNNDYKDGKLKADLEYKKFKEKILQNGNDFSGADKTLAELNIPLPARVFGCTGWKGMVRIKEINFDKTKFSKNPSGRIILGKNWFWKSPSCQGEFEIIFEVEKDIIEPIFYPLLTFMEKYGFWGGGWNIGYGRLKVTDIEGKSNWSKEEFEFSKFSKDISENFSNKIIDNFIDDKQTFNDLENKVNKILLLKDRRPRTDIKAIIEELIKIKAQARKKKKDDRANIKDDEFRHQIFGTVRKGKDEKILTPQGTKILPWIYEDLNDKDEGGNPKLKGGFVSIAGILNLEK